MQSDGKIIGQPVDFLYVDEAQDNLLIDLLSKYLPSIITTQLIIYAVLRILCCNADGLFWAGDTAQTISMGSSFKFNDLKAFLHRVERKRVSEALVGVQETPAFFQLTVNYRSHSGIVNCAHTLIDLISKFWPDSIDNLAAERAIVGGVKPVFFTGWDEGGARYEQFLFDSENNHVEFGAVQCIIVRNEDAKEKLRHEVGEIGVILTVYESKGLEFDDVRPHHNFRFVC